MAATDYYVTVAGGGGAPNNGLSWATAFTLAEFLTDFTTLMEPGDRYFFMGGQTYSLVADIITALDGSDALPCRIIGVASGTTNEPPVASDWASGGDRPLFACGSWEFYGDDYLQWEHIRYTTTAVYGMRADTGGAFIDCDVANLSGVANRYAYISAGNGSKFVNCDGESTNGYAIRSQLSNIVYCYFHDSSIGIYVSGASNSIIFSIVDTCTSGVDILANYGFLILNVTIYGCTTGITSTAGYVGIVMNCIINDCTTGASWTSEYLSNYWDYNNWEGNTTDVSNVTKGNNATANNPEFDNAAGGDFGLGDNEGACVGAGYAGELGGMGS